MYQRVHKIYLKRYQRERERITLDSFWPTRIEPTSVQLAVVVLYRILSHSFCNSVSGRILQHFTVF